MKIEFWKNLKLRIDKLQVKVTISDAECIIKTLSSTQIECYTGGYSNSSIKAAIQVYTLSKGQALNVINSN